MRVEVWLGGIFIIAAIIIVFVAKNFKKNIFVYEVYCENTSHEKQKISEIKGRFADVIAGRESIHIYRENNEWYYKDNDETKQMIFGENGFSDNINRNGPAIYIKKTRKKVADGRLLIYCVMTYVALVTVSYVWYQAFRENVDQKNQQELPEDPQGIQTEEFSLDKIIQKEKLDYNIDVPWNEYSQIGDTNERRVTDGEKATTYGINVSYYQQDIDWATVAEQGVQYAIIRIGYRGYENGKIAEDPNYEQYMQGVAKTDIGVGTYFFSQATTKEEMDEEIEYMLAKMKGYNITYPVGISLGRHSEEDDVRYRTSELSDEEYCNLLKYYCIRMKDAGYTPVIYFSSEQEYELLDASMLQGYPLWMTNMTRRLDTTQGVLIWQYRNYINLEGVEQKVGCSSCGLAWIDSTN